MTNGDEWLARVAKQMQDEDEKGLIPEAETLTVAELIGKFGFAVRKGRITTHLPNKLEELGLRCTPDFMTVWYGATVRLELEDAGNTADSERLDPTHRIDSLEAAHNEPISVKPSEPISAATTIMQIHDFSQLPVMQTEFRVDGIVSWKTIGVRTALGKEYQEVRHYMEPAVIVGSDTPLFDAIGNIAEHGYVLVRNAQNKISGIVTTSDLSNQFVQLARPFLLIGEIEGHLRNLMHQKFTLEELRGDHIGGDYGRTINGAADLAFGDYCRILENPKYWERLNVNIDRAQFVEHLHKVREIRNDVMHFNPDELDTDEGKVLRDVARFLGELMRIGEM